jgi:hypothetical protein
MGFSIFRCSYFWFLGGFGNDNQRLYLLITRKNFSTKGFIGEFKELIKYKRTFGFTITGSFMVYLSSSQQIFQNQYDLKEEFPYILPDWQ